MATATVTSATMTTPVAAAAVATVAMPSIARAVTSASGAVATHCCAAAAAREIDRIDRSAITSCLEGACIQSLCLLNRVGFVA